MATTHKGSCSCGAINIEVQGEPSIVGLCHCHNCQKSTGSTYSTNWVMLKSGFTIVSGEPTTYELMGGSGNPAFRKFCGTCSSTMWTESTMRPDLVIIKAGIMDDGGLAKFTPGAESFTSRKPGWVKAVEGATQFEESFPVQQQQYTEVLDQEISGVVESSTGLCRRVLVPESSYSIYNADELSI